MNLNEQLQQAYEEGRRQGLSEQRLRPFFVHPDIKPNIPSPDINLNVKPNQTVGLDVRGVQAGGVWNPNPPGPIVNWIDSVNSGIAPQWWTGSYEEFMRFFGDLINVIDNPLRPGQVSSLSPLFEDFLNVLMNMLYNPGNLGVPGVGGIMNELLQNPLFIQLFEQGWEFGIDSAGNVQFYWNSVPGRPGGTGLVPYAGRSDLPPVPP